MDGVGLTLEADSSRLSGATLGGLPVFARMLPAFCALEAARCRGSQNEAARFPKSFAIREPLEGEGQ